MLQQTSATIYLSGNRRVTESDVFRCCSTFDSEKHREPDPLLQVDEITLAPAGIYTIDHAPGRRCLLLPLVGTLFYEYSSDNGLLNPGELLAVSQGTMVNNPYEDDLVNFLKITLEGNSSPDGLKCFDIDSNKNRMIGLISDDNLGIYIGKFDGRQECIHAPSVDGSIFTFIISGAFEVENRLLEARDALTLWDVGVVEFEALSGEAVVLMIEQKWNSKFEMQNAK